jgi:hypothetical protein
VLRVSQDAAYEIKNVRKARLCLWGYDVVMKTCSLLLIWISLIKYPSLMIRETKKCY